MQEIKQEKKTAIFVINLEQDIQKKEYIQSHLKKYGIEDYSFIKAVDGRKLSDEQLDKIYDEDLAIKTYGRGLSRGEIGCALSHLSCCRKIISQNLAGAFVFEDDVAFMDHTKFLMGNIISNHMKNIDIHKHLAKVVLLSHANYFWKYTFAGKLGYGHSLKRVYRANCAHGYFISYQAAQQMLCFYSKIHMPIDAWDRIQKNTKIKIYSCYKHCVETKLFASIEPSTRTYSEIKSCGLKKRPLYRRIYRKIRSYYPKRFLQKVTEYTVGITHYD